MRMGDTVISGEQALTHVSEAKQALNAGFEFGREIGADHRPADDGRVEPKIDQHP